MKYIFKAFTLYTDASSTIGDRFFQLDWKLYKLVYEWHTINISPWWEKKFFFFFLSADFQCKTTYFLEQKWKIITQVAQYFYSNVSGTYLTNFVVEFWCWIRKLFRWHVMSIDKYLQELNRNLLLFLFYDRDNNKMYSIHYKLLCKKLDN